MEETRPYWQRLPLYIYVVLTNSYGFVTCCFIFLWLLTGEHFWFVRLFFTLMPPFLLPALIALPIGLVLRKWRSVLLVMPACLAFVWLYGMAFVPKQAADVMPNLTVLTYNLHTHNTDFAGIADVIRDSDADVVAMQELTPTMVDFLLTTFGDEYLYHIVRTEKTGTIMLSRYPIRDAVIEPFPYGIVDVNGLDVMVYAVHLPVPNYEYTELGTGRFLGDDFRRERFDLLRSLAAEVDIPQVMMGDFNMTDSTQIYREMAQSYTDVFRTTEFGIGRTFPNWRGINPDITNWPALIRIDYVFVSSEVIPISAEVLRTGESDHFALRAQLFVSER